MTQNTHRLSYNAKPRQVWNHKDHVDALRHVCSIAFKQILHVTNHLWKSGLQNPFHVRSCMIGSKRAE